MKQIAKLIFIAGVTLGVSGGLWYYLTIYSTKSKASSEVATVRFAPNSKTANGGDEVRVDVILSTNSSTNTNGGISTVDLSFSNTGDNLDFLTAKTTAALPTGFDDFVLNEAAMTSGIAPKLFKRVMLISKRPATQLQKSVIIPLYFKVIAGGASTSTKLTINTSSSQVGGPPGMTYAVNLDPSAADFTVGINNFAQPEPVASVSCDTIRNASPANCGRGMTLSWSDTASEEGYKLYRNGELIKTIGKDTTSYTDAWCANFNTVTYSVESYNPAGAAASRPSVSCACQVCPPEQPPAPTPQPNPNSADIIFRVNFPNTASTVNVIPDVKITILDDAGNHVCPGDTDCAKVVAFTRVAGSRVFNTFQSPRLAYNKMSNQGYTVLVKQNHTVRQQYKHVFLKTGKVLFCIEGNTDSGCGELIGAGASRPLFSGDLNGSNGVDILDAQLVNTGTSVGNTAEGDLNFDGLTDDKDLEIVAANNGKKGL